MRADRPSRAEVAAALGIALPDFPPPDPPVRGERHCVLVVVVRDNDHAIERLRPHVLRAAGLGWDLSPADALRRWEEVRAHA